jgi:hypothetical protein
VCSSAVAGSESVDYPLIPTVHCLGVPVASDVWFLLLDLFCCVVPFFLLLFLIFTFYPLCEVLGRILFGALCSLVHMPWNPEQRDFSYLLIHYFPNGLCLRVLRPFSVRNSHHCTQRVSDYHLSCAVYNVYDRRLFVAIY